MGVQASPVRRIGTILNLQPAMRPIMSRSLRLLLVATLFLPALLSAQSSRLRAVEATATTIRAADLLRDVSILASDAFAGRATPSVGFDSAASFVARQLRALRITPMGDSGTYLLHYPLVRAVLDTTQTMAMFESSHWMVGKDFLVTSFLTPGLRNGGVVYVGHGIKSQKLGLDAYQGLDLKGKWVVAHSRLSLPEGVTREQLGTVGVDYTTVLEEARRQGALGILTVPSAALLNGWDASRRRAPVGRDLQETVGRAYAPYPLPQVLASRAMIESLFGSTFGTAAAILTADSLRHFPPSLVLNPSRQLSIHLVAQTDTVRPYNVVGFVAGSDPVLKNEWVIIGSHLDGAVGRGANAAGDSIFNAADDNATGSAGTMAIARALMAGPRPKRSVLFVWDSGEETGLWGSRFLAYGPLAKQAVTYINVDMIGRTKAPGSDAPGEQELSGPGEVYVVGPGLMSTMHERILGQVVRDFHFATLNRRYEKPDHEFFYPRTDAAPYMEQGFPAIQFFTGLHGDYHRQSDEVIKLDPAKMEAAARTAYVMLWLVADDSERPRFDKPVPPSLWFVTPR